MVNTCVCKSETEIREILSRSLDELVREKQEVKISSITVPAPIVAVLEGYGLLEQGCDVPDTLCVFLPDRGTAMVFYLNEILYFEVLPTRRMTPELAYKQMKEMERIVGL